MYLKWGHLDHLVTDGVHDFQTVQAIPFSQRLHRLVELASRLHILPMTCLPRAVTLQGMLKRHAIPSLLRIGVARAPAGMLAHAWVEVAGVPIGEADDVAERFSLLEHIPSHPDYKFTL